MRKRNLLDVSQVSCAALCGGLEDNDHLFFKCGYYGRLWLLVSNWLRIDTIFHGDIVSHSNHFSGLGGFSKNSRTIFTIIWSSVLFVIWKDRNRKIFHNQMDQLVLLAEKVKL